MIVFSLRIIQFAPVLMFTAAAYSIEHNYCMVANFYKPVTFDNEVVVCDNPWPLSKLLYAIGFLVGFCLFLNEVRLFKNRNKVDKFQAF